MSAPGEVGLATKDLLGLEAMSREEMELILTSAEGCKQIFARDVKKFPTLRGHVLVNLFYEPSTRTRTSFEVAGKWMSADVINISAQSSSVVKGESLIDTARTLEALGADFVVIRHPCAGAPHLLCRHVRASVINAGDGAHEHPTQGLLDLLTLRQRLGALQGAHVAIVGDIQHSRVARSDIWGLTRMGARVTVVGPATLMPPCVERLGVEVSHDFDAVLPGVDAVHMLRIQRERQGKGMFPSLGEYARRYGLTRERLRRLRRDAVILHPGPANLGVEIAPEVVSDPRSAIAEQVTNGVAVRMAVLYLLSGGRPHGLGA